MLNFIYDAAVGPVRALINSVTSNVTAEAMKNVSNYVAQNASNISSNAGEYIVRRSMLYPNGTMVNLSNAMDLVVVPAVQTINSAVNSTLATQLLNTTLEYGLPRAKEVVVIGAAAATLVYGGPKAKKVAMDVGRKAVDKYGKVAEEVVRKNLAKALNAADNGLGDNLTQEQQDDITEIGMDLLKGAAKGAASLVSEKLSSDVVTDKPETIVLIQGLAEGLAEIFAKDEAVNKMIATLKPATVALLNKYTTAAVEGFIKNLHNKSAKYGNKEFHEAIVEGLVSEAACNTIIQRYAKDKFGIDVCAEAAPSNSPRPGK